MRGSKQAVNCSFPSSRIAIWPRICVSLRRTALCPRKPIVRTLTALSENEFVGLLRGLLRQAGPAADLHLFLPGLPRSALAGLLHLMYADLTDFLATGAQLGMLGQGDTQSRTISSEIPIESYERSRPQNPERSRSPIERTSNRRSWTQQMNLTHLKNDNMK